MKKILAIIFICLLSATFISAKSEKSKQANYQIPDALAQDIKTWPKEKIEYLSSVYLELGKQFYEIKKMKNAKACFMYSIQVLPTAKAAEESKALLKKYWKIIIP